MIEIKQHINKEYILIILLTLVAPLLTFAEEPLGVEDVNAMRLQAESDAKKDVGKITTALTPFAMGMGSAFAGAMSGVMTACCTNLVASDELGEAACVFAGVAGASPFFLALVKHYNAPPPPPIERLIGKPPEYVKAYTDTYGKKMRSKRLKAASAGAAAGLGIIVGLPFVL